MKTLARQFALIFFLGFSVVVVAFGFSAVTGELLNEYPLLIALRAAGIGFMAVGATLWVAQRRYEADKPELNPLFMFIGGAALLVLLVAVLFYGQSFASLLGQVGVIIAVGGLVLALLITIISPAFPEPVEQVWPAGKPHATGYEDEHGHDEHHDDHGATVESAEPDDLTKIEGIGPKLQQTLYDSGVKTYAMLGAKSPEEITGMIKETGFRAPFNAASWPEQARLAAEGNWDDLEKLQDELVGGRRS